MSKLKIGVIGCGSIARFRHLREFANKEVEIVAVCDIVEERAKEMAEMYNAKAYTSYEELLDDEKMMQLVFVYQTIYMHLFRLLH